MMTNLKSVIKKKETVNAQTQMMQQHYSKPSQHANTKPLNKAIKKKEKELMSHKSHASSAHTVEEHKIEPPKLHRDMRLICDVFRITEESRYALRTFDATNLDDYNLMTESDFIDLIATRARLGCPLPPLQQRKLNVLRRWVQSLPVSETTVAPIQSEGFEVKESTSSGEDNVKNYSNSVKKDVGRHTPSDWEDRFYRDLPRLRKELREEGEGKSNYIFNYLGLRWLFCQ